MNKRLALTAVILLLWGVIDVTMKSTGMIVSGEASTLQFSNSDLAYVASNAGMHSANLFSYSWLVILMIMVMIWLPVIRKIK